MRSTELITSFIDQAARLWIRGKDTLEIARELRVPEAYVYARLGLIRPKVRQLRRFRSALERTGRHHEQHP